MFCHNNKAWQEFQHAMYVYISDFKEQEMVSDNYDYTKLFGLWKAEQIIPKYDKIHSW